MNNSRFARPIPFGTNWNKIRIGVRWHMIATANITGTPRLAIGVCSGSTNILGDASCTHFVGTRQVETTWTWVDATPDRIWCNGSTWENLKMVGTTPTLGTSLGLNAVTWGMGAGNAAAIAADRSIFFLDITKGSPNYTLQIFGLSGVHTTAITDISHETLLIKMEEAVPVLTNYQHATARTLAVDEGANGVLDHINIMWDRSTPRVEICDIAIGRFS
jgi:hypothetical protein